MVRQAHHERERTARHKWMGGYFLGGPKQEFQPVEWVVSGDDYLFSGTEPRMATSIPYERVTVARPQPWHAPERRR